MKRTETAHALAADIDRLAYLTDPYEYWDVIGGRDDESISAHVAGIAFDLMTGNARPYLEWLAEQVKDHNNSEKDRCRAYDRLIRLENFLTELNPCDMMEAST